MAKRKDTEDQVDRGDTPKRRKSTNGKLHDGNAALASPTPTPSKLRSVLKASDVGETEATPRSVRKVLFSEVDTPARSKGHLVVDESPLTKARRQDGSARKKSNHRLLDQGNGINEDEAVEGERSLAEEILNADDVLDEEIGDDIAVAHGTPSKAPRTRGRPKGSSRRERTPTPPYDLPPHELYFHQNRAGGAKTSSNTLPSGALLNHDDYFAAIASYTDMHAEHRSSLLRRHAHSFEQWTFELSQDFSLLLHGYGSKRALATSFATHLHETLSPTPKILVINGYNPALTIKDIVALLSRSLLPNSLKAPTNPSTFLPFLVSHLSSSPPPSPIHLLIHSLDAAPLRKIQPFLATLITSPHVRLIATADTPLFPLLHPLPLAQKFRFVHHDTTTFAPYDVEIDAVDEVNTLLGRSGRRVGGKDGVVFVLRSLPENARGLFRLLVAEQLTLLDSGIQIDAEDGEGDEMLGFEDDEAEEVETPSRKGRRKEKEVNRVEGVEYRMLYHRAVEEFVCSSEMGFRTLLKEFHDHRIVESRRDGAGGERLVVPFGREELEGLLEELI